MSAPQWLRGRKANFFVHAFVWCVIAYFTDPGKRAYVAMLALIHFYLEHQADEVRFLHRRVNELDAQAMRRKLDVEMLRLEYAQMLQPVATTAGRAMAQAVEASNHANDVCATVAKVARHVGMRAEAHPPQNDAPTGKEN